ncbi:MAG: hypothetical protein ABS64_10100 [Microbacterium sp. SCN 69-37]|nr:MAG: hypothetical protein ABS64_10100 [Microbacterium sp. SCN 69-37]
MADAEERPTRSDLDISSRTNRPRIGVALPRTAVDGEGEVWHVDAAVVGGEGAAHRHAESDRDVHRGHVRRADLRVQLVDPQRRKRPVTTPGGGLDGVPVTPVSALEQVADLDDLVVIDLLPRDAALPDHPARPAVHHRPQPETVVPVPLLRATQPRRRFRIAERAVVRRHRLRVVEDRAQVRQILVGHLSQPQPGRRDVHATIRMPRACANAGA